MKMKVRCVKHLADEDFFTVGKEYTWEDDSLTSDTGFTYTTMVSGSDPKEWQLSSYYEFEVVPAFKVGDKVVAKANTKYAITTNGWRGKVVAQLGGVIVVRGKEEVNFRVLPEYFELDKSVQPWKIVIESSGDTTTAKYIEGKTVVKTESVTRYHADEYSVAKAVEAVTDKLFPEKAKPKGEPRYKVGDLVECIDDWYEVNGKRGYLVKKDTDGCWLVDFKVEYPGCHDGDCLPGKTGLWLVEDICFKKVK